MTKSKKEIDLEEFKYLIDSRGLSEQEEEENRIALLKAREKGYRERTPEVNRDLRLMQIYFQMRSYLDKPDESTESRFTEFLKMYSNALYEKHKDFASDLGIKPITLSQVLNRHREPQEIFLRKLVQHSEKVFKEIGYLKKNMWPRIYYQDKLNHFVSLQEEVMEDQAAYVCIKRIGKKKL